MTVTKVSQGWVLDVVIGEIVKLFRQGKRPKPSIKQSQEVIQVEAAQIALEIAQSTIHANWGVQETRSGGWVLEIQDPLGGIIIYLMNPCTKNMGETGKPYQVNCGGIRNFATLDEALNQVNHARN